MTTTAAMAPLGEDRRIGSIDVLRGLALLGILVLNIQAFSMPFEAYVNPTAWGDLTGANYLAWYMGQLLADMKFMAIFSMLFGAGIVLMTERLEATGRPVLGIHYRRMVWLLVIGFGHAYLLWHGDILVSYAICGMLVVWCRRLPPVVLALMGLAMIAVVSMLYLGFGFLLNAMPPDKAATMMNSGSTLQESILWQKDGYRGGWAQQMDVRVPMALIMQTKGFFFFVFWRAGGLMLLGMALHKWGVFTAKRSSAFYLCLLGAGILVGLPVVAWGLHSHEAAQWDPITTKFLTSQYNYWGSIIVALGWTALIMLIVKWGILRWLQTGLAAVGRMALTNYLLQSIVCITLFYGHGLGWYGSVERTGQAMVVLVLSIAQLIWSPLWLAAFRFGPAEWVWRSLTYWRLQPMRRSA
jgi:uncharacterized protein